MARSQEVFFWWSSHSVNYWTLDMRLIIIAYWTAVFSFAYCTFFALLAFACVRLKFAKKASSASYFNHCFGCLIVVRISIKIPQFSLIFLLFKTVIFTACSFNYLPSSFSPNITFTLRANLCKFMLWDLKKIAQMLFHYNKLQRFAI